MWVSTSEGIWSTSSLPVLPVIPGTLWPRIVISVKVSSLCQTDL